MSFKTHHEDSNPTTVPISIDDKLKGNQKHNEVWEIENFDEIESSCYENNLKPLIKNDHTIANIISMEDLPFGGDNPNDSPSTKKIIYKRLKYDVARSNAHVIPLTSSSKNSSRKSRQSFSMATKIVWVKEFQACPQGTNMRKWLEDKNISENTSVSYTSFRRWNMSLKHMTNKDISRCSSLFSKKIYCRPHSEMEKVLVEFLRIRNQRLRAFGRRKSTPGYIKAKAMEFYVEMYGDDCPQKFKASNGWLGRFQDSYVHLLNPDFSEFDNERKNKDVHSNHETTENTNEEC